MLDLGETTSHLDMVDMVRNRGRLGLIEGRCHVFCGLVEKFIDLLTWPFLYWMLGLMMRWFGATPLALVVTRV